MTSYINRHIKKLCNKNMGLGKTPKTTVYYPFHWLVTVVECSIYCTTVFSSTMVTYIKVPM